MSDNSSDEEVLVLTLALAAAEEEEQEKQWIHPVCVSREQEGEYFTLFPHLKRDDKKFFYQYFRMSCDKFIELHSY